MKEPQTIEEVANWVIVNGLRCPTELQISIVSKLLKNMDNDAIKQALTLAGVILDSYVTLDNIEPKENDFDCISALLRQLNKTEKL